MPAAPTISNIVSGFDQSGATAVFVTRVLTVEVGGTAVAETSSVGFEVANVKTPSSATSQLTTVALKTTDGVGIVADASATTLAAITKATLAAAR